MHGVSLKTKKEPKKREYKDGELNKLKRRIARLTKDNDRLKSELKSYETAFKETAHYIEGKLDNVPLQNVINGAKKRRKLKEIEETIICESCGSEDIYEIDLPFGKLKGCKTCSTRKIINE